MSAPDAAARVRAEGRAPRGDERASNSRAHQESRLLLSGMVSTFSAGFQKKQNNRLAASTTHQRQKRGTE